MTLEDDLRAEGDPEAEFNPGIAARLPKKDVAAAALLLDDAGRFLLLDPTYKHDWVLPGGVVEQDEDPVAGCERELREELGLDTAVGRLLVVDWVPRHGVWGDSLKFVFDGGLISGEQAAAFRLQAEEIVSAEWTTLDRARPNLRPSSFRRVSAALAARESGTTSYLRYGRPL